MKQLILVYDADFDPQITPVFRRHMEVARYSKITGVVGARMDALAESDFASEGRNNLILLVSDDDTVAEIVGELRRLREHLGDGLRGVVTNVEVLI